MEFTSERALIMDRTAIVADVHLGLENVLIEKGIALPRIQLDDILERLGRIAERVKRIVIAGDLKHEFGRNLPYEWRDVREVLEFLIGRGLEVVVVRGNHDNFLKPILREYGIELLDKYELKGWTIVHGHEYCDADKIIMGHEHPAVKIRINGVYTFHCFLKMQNIVVLPAFSPLVQGSDVTSCKFISPILSNVKCEEVEVYAVNDEVVYLGTVEDIKNLKIHMRF